MPCTGGDNRGRFIRTVGGGWPLVLTVLPTLGANTEGTFCSFPGYEMTQERHRHLLFTGKRGDPEMKRESPGVADRKHQCCKGCPYTDQDENLWLTPIMPLAGSVGGRENEVTGLPAACQAATAPTPCLLTGTSGPWHPDLFAASHKKRCAQCSFLGPSSLLNKITQEGSHHL